MVCYSVNDTVAVDTDTLGYLTLKAMVATYRGNSYETKQNAKPEIKTDARTYRGIQYKAGQKNG
jgi:hypothetical protein